MTYDFVFSNYSAPKQMTPHPVLSLAIHAIVNHLNHARAYVSTAYNCNNPANYATILTDTDFFSTRTMRTRRARYA